MSSKLIGISGGSASGKSTLANRLVEYFSSKAQILSLDNYYKSFQPDGDGSYQHINFDSPNSFDLDLFSRHLNELKHGKAIKIPQYDFNTHSRLVKTEKLVPTAFTIVEGLFLFNQRDFIEEYNFKT